MIEKLNDLLADELAAANEYGCVFQGSVSQGQGELYAEIPFFSRNRGVLDASLQMAVKDGRDNL